MNAAGGIDFNDFISKTVELFSKYPEVLHKYQKIYQQVLVDEFQDISSMQWELLKLLSGQSGQITVVGDVDQVQLLKLSQGILNLLLLFAEYLQLQRCNCKELRALQ